MNRSPATAALVIVILIIISGIGYWFFVRRGEDETHQVQPPRPSITMPSVSEGPSDSEGIGERRTTRTVIYTAANGTSADDSGLAPHVIMLPLTRTPARDSLRALIDTRHSPIPEHTHLRSVTITDGLATVDFSREFQTNFHGGDTEEANTINSILCTLGQFPAIERVQILVEGKPIDALSQLQISDPLQVIRRQAAGSTAGANGG